MANIRLYPPADGNHGTITVHGRTYTCAQGATIDVPDMDAWRMMHNGWVAADATVGPTSARPVAPLIKQTYYDTTLAFSVRFDGLNWRRADTGAVA
jgi:hypothetical protein